MQERRGNAFVIVAAAVVPTLALVGGGIDMSRGYLSRTRLQQACDAGVLATRKKIGSKVITDGRIPADAQSAGERFFNLNYQNGAYGTTGRTFAMVLDDTYSVNGTASATVPTTVMQLFGTERLPVTVTCSAQFDFANTDIMMVLDTTGSMAFTNPGDTKSRLAVLQQTVKDFYASVDNNRTQGVRIRFGFVPYSTNVNVGYLLKSSWMETTGQYETRSSVYSSLLRRNVWRYATTTLSFGNFTSGNSDTLVRGGSITVPSGGTPAAPLNVTAAFNGCIEERQTYTIDDYTRVDLTRARDLDIDAVPVFSDPNTKWRPILADASHIRSIYEDSWGRLTGSFSTGTVDSERDFIRPSDRGYAACPPQARKLSEMTASQVAAYVDGLYPLGSTYHDIGMIWGGRLISPTGIFANENGELNGRPTMRHLIFLTDGQTEPNELSYSSYGIEPISRRRWRSGAKYNLTQTVENRFSFACEQVKNKNVTVWVISFGTEMNSILSDCAGPGHWFEANNATQLSDAFAAIAAAVGDLRIVK